MRDVRQAASARLCRIFDATLFMNIKEAAEHVSMSVKTLERRIADGDIHVGYVPGKTGKQRDITVEELERFMQAEKDKAAATSYVARPRVAPVASDAAASTTLAPVEQLRALSMILAARQMTDGNQPAPMRDLATKLTLTREEAARFSGLPMAMICRAIDEGDLKAIRTGGGWRIKRADVESYVSNLR